LQARPGRGVSERVSDPFADRHSFVGTVQGIKRFAQSVQVLRGGVMSAVPTNVGVFFGQVDKRAEGWYWAGAQSEKVRGAIRGPFETKELAVKDALRSLREAPSDEPQERGAA
jgi:hypothetical protein